MKTTYQKPAPNESIYKHLTMLANFCKENAEKDPVKDRAEAFRDLEKQLQKMLRSRSVTKLQYYGE